MMPSDDPRPPKRETYDLLGGPIAPPALPGRVVVGESDYEAVDLAASDLVAQAMNCVREFGDFHLALSGGRTPQPLYERLMYDPDFRAVPWQRTHLWIVDERCVPWDDPRSNFGMIHDTIVQHADLPPEQVHPMPVLLDGGDAEYEKQIREALVWREKGQDRLDFVLLGMGDDGHTASLFPHSEALRENGRFVVFNTHASVDPPKRMTMTYPLLNAARFVAVLVTGAKKAPMIERIVAGNDSADVLPIKGIAPINGELKWFLDAAAAGHDDPAT